MKTHKTRNNDGTWQEWMRLEEYQKLRDEIAQLKAERDELKCEVKTLRNYIEKNSKILESIALILCESEDLPCNTDEFSWENMPELIAYMLGINDWQPEEQGK